MADFVLEAELSLKDNASSSMTGVMRAINQMSQSTKDANQHINELARRMSESAQEFNQTGSAANTVGSKLSRFWQDSKTHAQQNVHQYKAFAHVLSVGIVAAASAAATALGAIGVAGFQTGLEMQNSVSQMEAQLGLTTEQAKQYADVVNNVFTSGFGQDRMEVENLVAQATRANPKADKAQIEEMVRNALVQQQINPNSDSTAMLDSASVAAKNMNTDVGTMQDVMTAVIQQSGDARGELADVISEYSVEFNRLGLSAEQFGGILVEGAKAGIWNYDQLGDSVKESFISITDGSDGSKEAIKALGLDYGKVQKDILSGEQGSQKAYIASITALSQMKDPVKRNEIALALFKTKYEDLGDGMVGAIAKGAKGIKGFENSTKEAGDSLQNNLTAKMAQAWRQITSSVGENMQPLIAELTSIADAVIAKMPEITGAVDSVFKAISDVYNFFKDNWSIIEPIIVTITAAVAAYHLTVLALATPMMIVNMWTKALAIAQLAWNLAMSLNPLGLVVAGITAVVVAGIYLYKNWDTVKAKVIELWDKMGKWKALLIACSGPIGWLVAGGVALYKNWDVIKAKAGELWTGIKAKWSSIWQSTSETWGKVKTSISDAMTNATTKVKNFFQPLLDFIERVKKKWDDLVKSIKSFKMPSLPFMDDEKDGEKGEKTTKDEGDGNWLTNLFDGSLAKGIDYVPFDGYIAELHKGERVLTANENKAFSKGMLTGGGNTSNTNTTTVTNASTATTHRNNNVTVNMYYQAGTSKDEIAEELARELSLALRNI